MERFEQIGFFSSFHQYCMCTQCTVVTVTFQEPLPSFLTKSFFSVAPPPLLSPLLPLFPSYSHVSPPPLYFFSSFFFRPCASSQSCCLFLTAMVMLHPEDSTSLPSPYPLVSTVLLQYGPSPRGLATVFLGPSTQRSLALSISAS